MELKSVQVACVCLGVLGFIAAVITCAFPSWTVNINMKDDRQEAVYIGLWMVCLYKSISEYKCFSYNYKNSYTEVACGLTVTCCVITAISLLLLFSACRRSRDADPRRRWAAVGMMVSSLLLIIPVSLTASNIVSYRLGRWDLGVCMWTGWVGGSLLLLAGVTLCCCSCRPRANSQDTTGHHNHNALALRVTI